MLLDRGWPFPPLSKGERGFAVNLRGQCHHFLGELEEAEKDYTESINLGAPDHSHGIAEPALNTGSIKANPIWLVSIDCTPKPYARIRRLRARVKDQNRPASS